MVRDCAANAGGEDCRTVVAENQPSQKNRMEGKLLEVAGRVRAFMESCGSEAEFNALALEVFQMQAELNPAYRAFVGKGTRTMADWRDIPAMPASGFKQLELTCLGDEERRRVFFSSGSTQQERSRHYHGVESLELYEESAWRCFDTNFRVRAQKFVFLTPRARLVPNSSLAHMFEIFALRHGGRSAFVGAVDQAFAWELNVDECVRALEGPEPVAIFGTAFLFVHLADALAERGLEIQLPPGSWAMETGGYKGRSREVSRGELRALMTARLGIPKESIFSEYGMSELSSQAYDRADGVFRFPPWARARLISPSTGREAAAGERGLIRVCDLANVWSVMAVQTEDVGIGVGDGIELCGRATQAEARGCSLMSV